MGKIKQASRQGVCLIISLYRTIVSPLLGPRCRYLPSCSEYAQEAVTQHGVIKGSYLSGRRISRCHPWGGSGYDPVPEKHTVQNIDKNISR